MVSINRINQVNIGASLMVVALALTTGCPFNSQGTGSLVEIIPCADVTECDDANPCTTDTCEGAVCKYTNDDGAAAPDDEQECTIDACVAGMVSHAPSAEGNPCDGGEKVCNAAGQCVACSGMFGCSDGEICFEETTCVSCSDTVQNGGETGTDCGGPDCAGCPDGSTCAVGEDCASGRCDNGTCTSCVDGVQNGGETSKDCGGPDCGKCDGEACSDGGECTSTFCTDGVCCESSCDNTCVACNLPSSAGDCNLVPKGSGDESSSCTGTMTCDGEAACEPDGGKSQFSESCTNDGHCFNNACQESTGTCRLHEGDLCDADDQCASDDCDMNNECTG
jgi:hypothetical protein